MKLLMIWICALLFSCFPEYTQIIDGIVSQEEGILKEEELGRQFQLCVEEGWHAFEKKEWNKVEVCIKGGENLLAKNLPIYLQENFYELAILYYMARENRKESLHWVLTAKKMLSLEFGSIYDLYSARIYFDTENYKKSLSLYLDLIKEPKIEFKKEDYFLLGKLLEKEYEEFDAFEWAQIIREKTGFNEIWAEYLLRIDIEEDEREKAFLNWAELYLYKLELGSTKWNPELFLKLFPKHLAPEKSYKLLYEFYENKGLASSDWNELISYFPESGFKEYLIIKAMIDNQENPNSIMSKIILLENNFSTFASYYYHCLYLLKEIGEIPSIDVLYPIVSQAISLSKKGCLAQECIALTQEFTQKE